MATAVSRRDLLKRARSLALAAPWLGLVACDGGTSARRLAGRTMGTFYSVIADAPTGIDADIGHILETVNTRMSPWRRDSEVSRFNATRIGAWSEVSRDTAAVTEAALRMGDLTDGAFDPTIGPLVDLWGFGPDATHGRIPTDAAIEDALARTGYRGIRVRPSAPALAKRRPDSRIDLCGIAKGFGVDRIAARLDDAGIADYLVEIGGELRAKGRNAHGAPWRIGVERPAAGRRAVQRVVTMDRGAIATSGNYRNFFDAEGRRFAHIIDPRTGMPVGHALTSVTVVAPTAMEADALSTALMVMGPEAGYDLAREQAIAALFMVRDGERFGETATPAMARFMEG